MDTVLSNQASSHPSIDLVAEGMWRIAAGESCRECWEGLPEQQKDWWRSCATRAVRDNVRREQVEVQNADRRPA